MSEANDKGLSYTTARGSMFLLLKSVVTSVSSSVFFILIARSLPTVIDLGVINTVQAMITLWVLFSGLGLTGASTRFMAYHSGEGSEDVARGMSKIIFRIGFVSSLVASLILFLVSDDLSVLFFHDKTYASLLRIGAFDVFWLSIFTFCMYFLFSTHRFRLVSFVSIFNSVSKFALAFIFFVTMQGNLEGILIGFTLGDFLSSAIFLYYLRHNLLTGPKLQHARSLFRYAASIFGTYLVGFFSLNIDYYLLVLFTGLYNAGIYTPAVVIGNVMLMVIGSLDQALLPYFSRIYGSAGIDSLKHLSVLVSRYLLLIYLPLGFALLTLTPQLILVMFGVRYTDSILPAVILVAAITLTAIGTLFNNILLSTGNGKDVLSSVLFGLGIQGAITISTISYLGATGAALARASAYTIMMVYAAFRLRKKVGLYYDVSAAKVGTIGSALMGLSMFIFNYKFPEFYFMPVSLVVGFGVYILFVRFSKIMKTDDFKILDEIFMGKLKHPVLILKNLVVVSRS